MHFIKVKNFDSSGLCSFKDCRTEGNGCHDFKGKKYERKKFWDAWDSLGAERASVKDMLDI